MSFKIKDGVRIGTTDVFNDSGTLLVNAPTATKWAAARTVTLGGDLSGSVSVDGSADVTLTATIAANSVALGTDTTGNYIATIAGTPNQVSVSGSGSESAAVTLSLPQDIHSAATPTFGGLLANAASFSLINTTATTVNFAGAATTLSIGAATGTATIYNANTVVAGDLAVNGGDLTTTQTTFNLVNATATTVNIAGAGTTVSIGAGTGTTSINNNLTVTGNLTVNGTTTTVNSTTTTLDDPIFTLGGDTAPASDDNKDRGVEFRWHNGTVAKVGFFGYDDSTGKFTFIPDATNTSEVFSGTKGAIDANIDWADVTSKPTIVSSVTGTSPVVSSGGTTPAISLDSGYGDTQNPFASKTANYFLAAPNGSAGAPTFRAIVAADIPTLNQNTTGSAATLTTARNFQTNLASTSAASFNGSADNTHGVTGTLPIANGGTGLTSIGSANQVLGVTNAAGGLEYKTITAGSNITVTHSAGAITIAASVTEVDTLATVTGRGNTTDTGIILQDSTTVSLTDVKNSTVSTTSATAVDTFAYATYRGAKYLVQITQSTNYQISEILVLHNGTTTTMTEYAVLESGSALGTFTSDISGSDCRLIVTMDSATSATIRILKTYIAV